MSEATVTREGSLTRGRALAALRQRVRADALAGGVAIRVVCAGTAAYAALFVFAAVLHYTVFQTPHTDLGNMVQPIWNTLHGHFLEMTTLTGHQMSRLGFHVDPFLVLLAPLYWIWSSPLLLVVFQALAVTSGALPVFWLARKHLGSDRAGVHFAFAYLLYPATQFNAFTTAGSFHPFAIAVPLILYAIWFLDEDRLVPFTIVALLAATTKEEIPLAVGCLGIWYGVCKGRWRFGLAVLGVGLAITFFDFLWVIPHYSPTGVDPFVARYQQVGTTPGGILHKLVTDPAAFVQAVATGHKAIYVALLLVPFWALWLFEPLLLLGALPDLVLNLLSSKGNQTSLPINSTGGIVPFVVAASVLGAARYKHQANRISLYVLVSVACIAIFSPLLRLPADVHAYSSPLRQVRIDALSHVPPGVAVSASNQLGGHLSGRRYSLIFPYVRNAQWIVVDRADRSYGDEAGFMSYVRKYESDKSWQAVYSSHGVVVLRKRAAGP